MLEYKIDGPILQDGVPIHVATKALNSFHSIIDKTYLVATGSKKMTARDREVFQLKASSFSRGSLLTKFEIIISTFQLSLPLVSSLGPQNIWDYTKDTFNFLKLVCGAVQKGDKPQYVFNNDGSVSVSTGDTHQHYHGQVIQIGELALQSYQNLADIIEPKKINLISAGPCGQESPDLFLGANDKNIFDVPTRIEKETIELKCEIFDFNKYKNVGRLSVSVAEQAVPIGEYKFIIFGSQDNVEYIYSMLKREVELFCLIEMESNPFGEDRVHRLHITGVNS